MSCPDRMSPFCTAITGQLPPKLYGSSSIQNPILQCPAVCTPARYSTKASGALRQTAVTVIASTLRSSQRMAKNNLSSRAKQRQFWKLAPQVVKAKQQRAQAQEAEQRKRETEAAQAAEAAAAERKPSSRPCSSGWQLSKTS